MCQWWILFGHTRKSKLSKFRNFLWNRCTLKLKENLKTLCSHISFENCTLNSQSYGFQCNLKCASAYSNNNVREGQQKTPQRRIFSYNAEWTFREIQFWNLSTADTQNLHIYTQIFRHFIAQCLQHNIYMYKPSEIVSSLLLYQTKHDNLITAIVLRTKLL